MAPKSGANKRRRKAFGAAAVDLPDDGDFLLASQLQYQDEEDPSGEPRPSSDHHAQTSPQSSRKRQRSESVDQQLLHNNVLEAAAGAEEGDRGGDTSRLETRSSLMDVRHSVSNCSIRERSTVLRNDHDGFFHDLNSMRPLRVRLGVCPQFGCTTTNTTPLLLTPKKFFTLPEDKGGSDVVGWAAAFTGVSVDLPGQGIYNKAAASLTLMLPP